MIAKGTGRAAALDRPAAGKTGTSQDYRDAWFLGFTADYVAGVWFGNDDGDPMNHITGGTLPARLWKIIMTEAHQGVEVHPLPGQPSFWDKLESWLLVGQCRTGECSGRRAGAGASLCDTARPSGQSGGYAPATVSGAGSG